jgi:hypothetical protein
MRAWASRISAMARARVAGVVASIKARTCGVSNAARSLSETPSSCALTISPWLIITPP